ncbi:DUF6263 family protein [Tenacibaculum sp. SG-28]|uniref:DUF6263 family protein n=1 Tax=Tenacibaculum sp. SG-28 TaxID=754426 RepID=UPI000D4D2624|nr:DUF6263 family protein [Tenacibaculum sp. SG-28]PQJ19930.1 hypothetical protein BSU00_11490 [Tenacibaculum sp. SG-28]
MLLFTTVTFAQESVMLRLNYTKGDTYASEMSMSQMGAGGAMSTNMSMKMIQNITEASEAGYSCNIKFDKIAMQMNQGGQKMSYDSSKGDADLDPMSKLLKSQMDPVLSAVISMKGNSLGEVLETKVEPNIPGADQFTNQSSNVVYPKEAVTVGSSWEMKDTKQGMNFAYTYTVAAITKAVVSLKVSGKVTGVADGDITGNIEIDRNSGVPVASKLNMAMQVQGQDLGTNIEMTTTKL